MRRLCRILPLLAVLTAVPATAGAAADPAPAFDVLEFDVDGNTVLPQTEVEKVVYPFLGEARGFKAVEGARAALEKAYADSGYLSVSVVIPEQKVEDGVVRLQVVEGQVEKLRVSGNRYHARSELREQVPALAAGEVPHFPTVQEQLARVNRGADMRATPLLRPGRDPGKLEVELAVEDQLPLHGSLELNNRQSPNTTSQRLEANVRYDNLFQKGHSFGLNYIVSPKKPEEVGVLVASYSLPIGDGQSLSFSAQHSKSNIVGESAVVGKGLTLSARFIQQLRGLSDAPTFFHTLALGFDDKDLKETQSALGTDAKQTPLKYMPFVAQYTAGSFSEEGDLLGNAYFVAGWRGSSQRTVDCQGEVLDQFECRRSGAQANFSIFRGDFSYTHRMLGWELSARADVQAAGQPLVSPEQFLAGGVDSVRGYLEGEAAGDVGWRLRTEVKTPSLFASESWGLRGVAFADLAWLKLNDPLAGQVSDFRLAGSGVGFRLKAAKNLALNLDWAVALRDGPPAIPQPLTRRGNSRIHVRLNASF